MHRCSKSIFKIFNSSIITKKNVNYIRIIDIINLSFYDISKINSLFRIFELIYNNKGSKL